MCDDRRKSKDNNRRLLMISTDVARSISPLRLVALPRSIVLFARTLLVSCHCGLPPGKDSRRDLAGSE